MKGLGELFPRIESRRKQLDIYTSDEEIVGEFDAQFASQNLTVRRREFPPWHTASFVVVRDAQTDFQASFGIEELQRITSPESDSTADFFDDVPAETTIFDFLDDSLFLMDRREQLLAATREIEDRARRTGRGTLFVGFQRAAAFRAQEPLYRRFARETEVTCYLFIEKEWGGDHHEGLQIVDEVDGEIGKFWFVLFDGGGDRRSACALVAEQREDGYYGFWTYDAELVTEIIEYLETTYLT